MNQTTISRLYQHQFFRLSLSRWIIAFALLMIIGSWPLHAEDAEENKSTLMVYGNTTTIELAPVLLAADQIYQGDVIIRNGGIPNLYDGEGGSSLFEPGIADIATNAETQALRYSVDNPNLRILMTVSEGFYRIVARRSAGIEKLEDLRGKKIAMVNRTSSGFYLSKMLRQAGLTEDDVEIVSTWPMEKYKTALSSGEFDAVTIWEPGVEYAKQSIGYDAIEFQDRSVYRELFNLHTTAENLAHPEMRAKIVEFVRAIIAASKRIHENPEPAYSLVAERAGLDVDLIKQTWHHEGFPGTMVNDLLDVLEEEEQWVAKERDRTPRRRAELATLIDASVLQEAMAKSE